jgi:hypothetical protein
MKKGRYALVLGAVAGLNKAYWGGVAKATVALKWAANAQPVIGYEAYCGRTAKQIKTRLLPTSATLKLTAAMVRLDVLRDLIALRG